MSCNIILILFFCCAASLANSTGVAAAAAANDDDEPTSASNKEELAQNCAHCRLTGQSMDELIRKPRQMNAYGQVEERIDLDKIKKALCKEIANDRDRENCRSFFFTHLNTIERWKQSGQKISFTDFVCIKELKYCCPRNSFGSRCTKCSACGKNQICQGEGTRFGNGTCVCNEGHTGPRCASCKRGHHAVITKLDKPTTSSVGSSTTDEQQKVACKPCHRSCQYCRHEGPLGCEVCRAGFIWIPTYGCSDIDECAQNKKICGDNTFCVNTEGSYFCYECDRACDGCHGDGPDMCQKCATGYKLENGNCAALKKTLIPPEVDYYRYAIYFGLSLCSCIISYNNIYLASLVGLGVALYVGFSEYVMTVQYSEMMKQMGAAST